MDDVKLFEKNEKELETLIHAGRIYCQDIEMEFGIEKCAMQVLESGKRHLTDEMELPSQDKIRTLGEKETSKYLDILEADSIKQVDMKDKIRTIQQKPYQRNKNQGSTPRLIFGTLFEGDKSSKWNKEQGN